MGSQIWAVGPRAPNGGRAARKILAFERAKRDFLEKNGDVCLDQANLKTPQLS